jgi:AcrR family transcriptional regulator
MAETSREVLDPRIRRTRHLLQQALGKLLETKEFEKISVQDIAEAATLNRATFYDHYPDKFALLESMVAGRFHEFLAARRVVFNAGCASALRGSFWGSAIIWRPRRGWSASGSGRWSRILNRR